MSELFIPRQGRNLPTRPLQGIPRLRPDEPSRPVPVRPSPTRPAADDVTGPVAATSPGGPAPSGDGMPAGPGATRVRRGGPRHGRRTMPAPRRTGPVLAGVAGLVVGLCLGTTGWAVAVEQDRHAGLTEREIAVAGREARVAQLEQHLLAGTAR